MRKSTTTKRARPRTPNNRTTTDFRVSDALWAVLEPLIPVRRNTHRCGGGRPRVPARRCAAAIGYLLRTGGPWAARTQTAVGAKSPAHDRLPAWVKAGGLLQRWSAGVAPVDALPGSDGAWLRMDGALTTAPLEGEHAGAHPTDRGTGGVKRRLLPAGPGVPIGLAIDGATRHALPWVRAPLARGGRRASRTPGRRAAGAVLGQRV
jgi:putative transposase